MKADIILAAVIIIASFIGYNRGFIKAFLNMFFVLCSAFGCYLLYPYATDILSKTGLNGLIGKYITDYFTQKYLSTPNPDSTASLLIKYNVQTVDALLPKMVDGITLIIMNIISAIAVFVAIRLVCFLIKGVFGFLTKIPVIGSVDSILGAAVSFVSSMLIIFLFFAVILLPPCNKTEFSYNICKEVDKSFITKEVMEYNIFINYDTVKDTVSISEQ